MDRFEVEIDQIDLEMIEIDQVMIEVDQEQIGPKEGTDSVESDQIAHSLLFDALQELA